VSALTASPTTDRLTVNKEKPRMTRRAHRPLLFLLAIAAASAAFGASAASASAAEPHLRVTTLTPDHVTPGKPISIFVALHNDGDAPMSGNATITYTFPAAVFPEGPFSNGVGSPSPACSFAGQVVECTIAVGSVEPAGTGVPPGRDAVYQLITFVEPGASGILTGQIAVSGGGAPNSVTVPFSLDTSPIGPFDVKSLDVDMRDGLVLPATQAGGHPAQVDTDVQLLTEAVANLGAPAPGAAFSAPPESFRDVITHVPAGFVGNPTATGARCTAAELTLPADASQGAQVPACPRDSQVGVALLENHSILPVYNLVPPAGAPAEFALVFQGVPVLLRGRLRPSDDGVDIVSEKTSSSIPIPAFEVSFWGTPADTSHDNLRGECTYGQEGARGPLCESTAPRKPFLRTPTSCSGEPLPWSVEIDTYQHPGTFVSKSATTPALEGCDKLPFEPKLNLGATSGAAHTPSGLNVEFSMPQEGNAPDQNRLAEADLRAATVSLPEGVTVNPAAAEGLAGCSDAQLRLGLEGPSECPDASKIGTVELKTPLLEETVGGSVFIRSQNSSDPESGEMYRLAIELRNDERGIAVKLPGQLRVNPQTGQLTTVFTDLPQLPFERMQLHLNAGPHAPLTTPQRCGTYAVTSQLTSWARPDEPVSFSTPLKIDQNCTAPGFAPGFEAGVQTSTAGEFSPFTLRVTRDSGMPSLSSISATLPEGELAKLAGVPLCPDAAAATGACPAGSKIGSAIAGVGEGPDPLYVPQPGKSPTAVYLAGPYKGAPYSVVAAVPAQSGPFDLGTVTVRSALRVDPVTTRATVASDPLPQIFGGIPVAYRDVRVLVNRPEFTISPTSCEPQAVDGSIGAANGAGAAVSARFQVADCAALGFEPKLSIGLRGKTRRAGHPALTAVLQMPQGGANIARTSVALPHSEFLAQSHINTSCTRVQYAAGGGGGAGCPAGSVYGHARAFSPLLDQPLEGPVYLRSNGGERELPDLVASLGGLIHVDLVGYIDTDKKTGGLRTSFAQVPDAPVSKFVLKIPGGMRSLLENSTNICRGKHRATVKMDGQNGKVHDFRPLVRARCGEGRQAQRGGR
jgi:hypothetical protein